jgi:predicted dehydrogenase
VPLLWRFQKKNAGSGAHGDLNAHIIDMARFITGDEITEVIGSVAETFIKQRKIIESGPKGGIAGGTSGGGAMGTSDVDDAGPVSRRDSARAPSRAFEATRLATGQPEPQQDRDQRRQGLRPLRLRGHELPRLLRRHRAAQAAGLDAHHGHARRRPPYVGNWWPDAHIIGYEHGFINQLADILYVIGGKPPVVPLPDFEDAFKTQQVARSRRRQRRAAPPVKIEECSQYFCRRGSGVQNRGPRRCGCATPIAATRHRRILASRSTMTLRGSRLASSLLRRDPAFHLGRCPSSGAR